MQKFSWLRALTLGFVLLLAATITAHAQEAYKVVSIRPIASSDLIKVGHDWRKDLKMRLQVSLQVGADTPSSSVFVHAYFYDKDDHLIDTAKGPNAIWTETPKGLQEVLLPPTLPRFKVTNVYFDITEELHAKKWTSVVVAFGDNDKVAALSMPGSVLAKVDFPEKTKLAPPK